MTKYTSYQDRYFAEQLLLKRPQSSYDSLASAMSGVKVDLNPHQVDAALFAMQSPLSSGVLMADEVGLGKTIEAGLVLAQYWAERKRNILLIVPAALRTQWRSELRIPHIFCNLLTKGTLAEHTQPITKISIAQFCIVHCYIHFTEGLCIAKHMFINKADQSI